MRKRLLWPCLLLTAAALALYPILSHFYFEQQKALPPGISRRETRLLRIWLLGDLQGAETYLDTFCKKSDTAKQYVQKWMPIVAASQSVKGKPEERQFLLGWVDVVEYE